ncbi:STAS domain-containing protein [Coleofasciculus sp. H7-2]|uniref:STAS domain-containing protein n=1 Tax=Coleofasciculus sp. H7-2 TaxID=3351545 RepID=UPI00366CC9A9
MGVPRLIKFWRSTILHPEFIFSSVIKRGKSCHEFAQVPENTKASHRIVIQPQGVLNRCNGATLQQWIVNNVVLDAPALCVLDMTHINGVDSSGLFSLVAGLKAARKQQCRIVICNLQFSVKTLFEAAQLEEIFDIEETYESALAKLARATSARVPAAE